MGFLSLKKKPGKNSDNEAKSEPSGGLSESKISNSQLTVKILNVDFLEVFIKAAEYVEAHLSEEGLYRVSGSKTEKDDLSSQFLNGGSYNI